MALALSIFLFLLLVGVITAYGYKKYVRPSQLIDRLSETPDRTVEFREPDRTSFFDVFRDGLVSLGKLLPLSPGDLRLAQVDLTSAGFRSANAVWILYGIRLLSGAAFLIAAFFLREQITVNPILRIVVLFAGAWAGYAIPGYAVDFLASRRRLRIRFALPDMLDLLVVCTEAGCALDQAMLNVSRELGAVHPDLSDEITLMNLALQAGASRPEAMRALADRTGEEELRKLIAILIQTDRFGTSVSDALRTQSDYLRIRRRQDAEEKAGKVGVKLVFPIFFFCLPSLFLVTAGPGILQLVKNLFPMMRNMH